MNAAYTASSIDGTMPGAKLCRVERFQTPAGHSARQITRPITRHSSFHRLLRKANSESSTLKGRHTPSLGAALTSTFRFVLSTTWE
jgi:hypothetical protein